MKMNKLRFVASTTVDLPLAGLDESGPFVLKSVDGLGPPDTTVMMARTNQEKAVYQGKSAALRQVIVLVGLNPNWDEGQTPEELRTLLYNFLTPRKSQMIRLEVVHNDVVQGYIQGQISKIEPALFTPDPAAVITLESDYPYILAPTQYEQVPVPYADASYQYIDVENPGNAPAGFKFGMVFDTPTTDPHWIFLSDGDAYGQLFAITGVPFLAGDILTIDTRPGSKGAWRTPSGTPFKNSLLNNISGGSQWMYLYPGTNTLRFLTTGTGLGFHIDPTIKFIHTPAFWGV